MSWNFALKSASGRSRSATARSWPEWSAKSNSRRRTTPTGPPPPQEELLLRQCADSRSRFRLQSLEHENACLRDECGELRGHVERLRGEKRAADELLAEAQVGAAGLRQESDRLRDALRWEQEQANNHKERTASIVQELSSEV